MQHPRPKPGARGRFGTSLAGEYPESIRVPAQNQDRPLGLRLRRARCRASFLRQAVFDAFGARHARALDQGGFTDHSPDAQMHLAPGAWSQKGAAA